MFFVPINIQITSYLFYNMPFQPDLNIFKCPLTEENVDWADITILNQVNQNASKPFEKGLVNQSKTLFYPVIREVLVLLPYYAIALQPNVKLAQMSFDKDRVFRYYNEISYKEYENNITYSDTGKWIDYRDVSKAYLENSFGRAKQYLNGSGKYYLDIASGSIGFKEYIDLSSEYEIRICVDISLEALLQAAKNLEGKKAIFVCGDITQIPIKSNICDAVLSQHTLYHIPKEEQATAVKELYRVCKEGGKVGIVYNWFYYSPFMNLTLLPVQLYRVVRHIAGKWYVKFFPTKPRLYFFIYPPSWFKNFEFSDKIEIFCWRSTNKQFLDIYAHKSLGGAALLQKLQHLEDKYPKFFGWFGDYPIIVISK
ncbi:MAG: hypothetical protein RL329_3586 [Bacteroidota bacterium]